MDVLTSEAIAFGGRLLLALYAICLGAEEVHTWR